MALETTKRGSSQIDLAPSNEAIIKAMEVATTLDAAEYLYERAIERFKGLNMSEAAQFIIEKIAEYRDSLRLTEGDSNAAWQGKPVPTNSLQRLQENSVKQALEEILDNIQDTLIINYAVSEKSELIRGFANKDGAVNNEMAGKIDKLLNAFFAGEGFITKDGTVFETNQKGQIRIEKGEEKIANPQKINETINTKFSNYLKEKGIDKVDIYQRDFPEQAPEAPTVNAGSKA